MGVDTKAIIRKGVTITEIVETLSAKYSNVDVHSTHSNDFLQATFLDGNDKRMLSIFFLDTAKNDYKIDGVLLSLGYWGNSVEIATYLCETFGGYIDKNDCDDNDFEPIRLDLFEQGSQFTPLDEFKNKVISKLGYKNLNAALLLFDEYKTLTP